MSTDLQAWRDQVAAAVRNVKVIMPGGTCWLRSTMGAMALAHLGLRPERVIGGAIFRAGHDARMDSVSFCGPSNHAEFINGLPLFHHGAAQHKESEMPEPHSPAYMRALAEAGDDEDAGKRLAVAEVLWRETKGDVPEMLMLIAEIAAILSAAYGPETADVFRKAFDEAVPIAKRCIGTSVADQPAGVA